MTQKLISLLWGIVRSSFFDRALPGIRGPDRAMLLSPPSKAMLSPTSSHSNHGTSNNPVPKAPLTRGDRENPERFTFATPLASNTQFEYGPACPAHIHTSGRANLPVFRELDKANKGPVDAFYDQGISDTSRLLAKGTLVHYHSQQGAAICTTGGSEGEGGCPPNAVNRSSYCQSSLRGSKAWGRLEANNRLRYLNSGMVPPHFKMEGLFMLPSMVSQGWPMVKLDLKDA